MNSTAWATNCWTAATWVSGSWILIAPPSTLVSADFAIIVGLNQMGQGPSIGGM